MAAAPKVYYDTESITIADDVFVDAVPDEHPHASDEQVFSQDDDTPPVVRVLESSDTFIYGLGHRVHPAPSAPVRTVIWRGQLKERQTATGLVHRVNVYRLNDGFWDCYREDELEAA